MNEELFWSFVEKSSQCWIWYGPKLKAGYGVFRTNGEKYLSHRLSWQFYNKKSIPSKMLICHRCDNPPCVNPKHLFLGTHKDNMVDCAAKGRTTIGDKNPSRLYPERIPRGEKRPFAKLNKIKVLQIRKLYSQGNTSQYKLAEQFGVSQMAIWHAIHGVRNWTHV